MQELRKSNPGEQFEAIMRYSVVDQNTKQNIKLDTVSTASPLPSGYKAQYVPRIRCVDCPGKLYNAGPGRSVDNFQMHLNNRGHRANVEKRTGRSSNS
jgi:SWI/SNF-related matrix-associated actin-dependent regulator of chromatin subfamily B member 1